MPNLVGIPPVVWAPNPNKQTDKQTGLYIVGVVLHAPRCSGPHPGEERGRPRSQPAIIGDAKHSFDVCLVRGGGLLSFSHKLCAIKLCMHLTSLSLVH